MPHARALLLVAALAVGTALGTACDRSVTAPGLEPARAGLGSATEQQLTGNAGAGSTMALVPVVGGRIDLAARPGYPVDCTLEVPAGALDGPTIFELTGESAGADVAVRVTGQATELQSDPQAFGDQPILLTLTYAAPEGTQDVTVEFSPPDGSETVVVRATLHAGRATVLAFRRGRSKYSVIFF